MAFSTANKGIEVSPICFTAYRFNTYFPPDKRERARYHRFKRHGFARVSEQDIGHWTGSA